MNTDINPFDSSEAESDADVVALLRALNDADEEQYEEQYYDIVEQFGQIGERAIQPLITLLIANSHSYGNRFAFRIIRALVHIGPPTISSLNEMLEKAPRPLWDNIIYVLCGIRTADAIQCLIRYVRTIKEDDTIRLLDEYGEEIVEYEEKGNHISTQGSRWEIIETGITNIGPPVIPFIRPFLNDTDRRIRHFVVGVLMWIGDQHGSDLVIYDLIRQLQDSDPIVRTITAYGLQLLDDERCMPALLAALSDTHADVRWLAAGKLGTFHNPAALDMLKRVLNNPTESPAVKEAAQWSVNEIFNPTEEE